MTYTGQKLKNMVEKYPNLPIYAMSETTVVDNGDLFRLQEIFGVEHARSLWYDGKFFYNETNFVDYYIDDNYTCTMRRGQAYDEVAEELYEEAICEWDKSAEDCIIVWTELVD